MQIQSNWTSLLYHYAVETYRICRLSLALTRRAAAVQNHFSPKAKAHNFWSHPLITSFLNYNLVVVVFKGICSSTHYLLISTFACKCIENYRMEANYPCWLSHRPTQLFFSTVCHSRWRHLPMSLIEGVRTLYIRSASSPSPDFEEHQGAPIILWTIRAITSKKFFQGTVPRRYRTCPFLQENDQAKWGT